MFIVLTQAQMATPTKVWCINEKDDPQAALSVKRQ